MAKVTITLEDKEDGEVLVGIDFDPPIQKGEDGTAAQHAAIQLLDGIHEISSNDETDDDDFLWDEEEP